MQLLQVSLRKLFDIVVIETSTNATMSGDHYAEFDFRFGWRWLLPSQNGKRWESIGLSSEEHRWWQHGSSPALFSNHSDRAHGYLIALDSVAPDAIANQINEDSPPWLCAWGAGSSISRLRSSLHGFASVREYALLPAGNPRVVVPLSSPGFVEAGLRLHRPGRWLAQLGMLMARGLARLGNYSLLRRKVLLIASREENAWPLGAMQAGLAASSSGPQLDYALYLGTPDDNRKTVVLPLGNSEPSVILKAAETPRARAALQNEAHALKTMGLSTLAARVPRFIGLEDAGGRLTLLQEYRQRHVVGKDRMTVAVLDFLAKLNAIGRERMALADWLGLASGNGCVLDNGFDHRAGLPPFAEEAAAKLRARVAAMADRGAQLWLHRNHGDFAPWNCAWTVRGLFVFDWEESREHRLALDDAFYYVLSPFVHVHKKPDARKALVMALQFAGELAPQLGFAAGSAPDREAAVRLYLALWLLGRLNQSPFYGELVVRLEQSWV